MDISEFSNSKFDGKEWINNMFSNSQVETKEQWKSLASSMIMKLQLSIQEVSNNLEETTNEVLLSLPRVQRDAVALMHEANMLRDQMKTVKVDVEKVEQETANSMQTLVELDSVKERLLSSSQALKEADNWTTLTSEIEEVMETGDIEEIANKLMALRRCLQLLHQVPDFEERSAHVEGLIVRLEALASPKLIMAFTQKNLENAKKYSKLLSSLDRQRNVLNCYHQCELQQLHKFFLSNIEGHQMSGSPTWLSMFYEKVVSAVTTQMKWCSEVFPDADPVQILSNLCLDALNSLDPSISSVVSIAIKQQDEPLDYIQTIKNSGDSFIQDYRRILCSTRSDVEYCPMDVVKAVYQPMRDQMKHYQEYEESLLLSHLISSDVIKSDLCESLSNLKSYLQLIVTQAELSIERCMNVSNGAVYPSLVAAQKTYLENINERLHQLSKRVDQQSVSIEDDWTIFNTCLSLMETSGEFLLTIESLEVLLSTKYHTVRSRMTSNKDSDHFTISPQIMLDDAMCEQLQGFEGNLDDNSCKYLDSCLKIGEKQCESSVDIALHTIMTPVSSQLSLVPNMAAWNARSASKSNISVTLSPQEYVTQIGQYLMTLPQHLEPLLSMQSQALTRVLRESSRTSSGSTIADSDLSAVDFLIGNVSHSVCSLYTDVVLRIPQVAPNMITQLTTDIDYICNILEDLGADACDPLSSLNELLKAPTDQYVEISLGKTPRLIAAVRQMRNIPSKS